MKKNNRKYFEYKDYFGSVHYSRNDKCYHGKVLGLNKMLLSYEGITISDLEIDFKNAIDEYLDYCNNISIEPQKTSEKIMINFTEFVKHIGIYLDLARVRKIIITRFQGKKMEFYGLRPIDDISCLRQQR